VEEANFFVKERGRYRHPRNEEQLVEYATRTYPLNSRRLMAETLSWIARGLGLLTNTSPEETRGEAGRGACRNMQVYVMEFSPGVATVRLVGESGLIVQITADEEARGEREQSSERSIGGKKDMRLTAEVRIDL
jgi:hypothetical protein